MRKGLGVNALGGMALLLVVAAIIIGMGSQILMELADNQCSGSIGNFPGNVTNGTNPVTSNYYGCCATVNATQGDSCTTWETTSAAINATFKGNASMTTLGDWLPMIALVIVAAIVIGIIVTYLGRAGRGSA